MIYCYTTLLLQEEIILQIQILNTNEIIRNLSINKNNNNNNNNNWRKEYEKLKWAFNFILVLNAVVLDEVQYAKDRFRNYSCSSFPSTFSYENSDYDDRKQEGAADSTI
jgi:hypothetical protein